MVCEKCQRELKGTEDICPKCGHRLTRKKDLEELIDDYLKEDQEDAVVPTFSDKRTERTRGKEPVDKGTKVLSTPKNQNTSKATKSKKRLGSLVADILRYGLALAIVLSTLGLFFTWFDLSGNGVNWGFIRNENSIAFMVDQVSGQATPSLEHYSGPILTFSAYDLYLFGRFEGEAYELVKGAGNQDKVSLSAKIHRYYMMSIIVLMFLNALALGLTLLSRRLKAMAFIRNLSAIQFLIIGLNYLALKVPYFSMFAIHAKDLLGRTAQYPELSMTKDGIAMNQVFYPYQLAERGGLYFTLAMTLLWLVLGIILAEVRNRREEIEIETGEVLL